jgi:GMP synthase (glutamine-hydrolysing)
VSSGVLVVDNLSPFTPNILSLLNQLGAKADCMRYDLVQANHIEYAERVILSGRRSGSAQTNAHNSRFIRQCKEGRKCLLGICYGAEIIALSLGGTVTRMPAPSRGLEQINIASDTPITRGMEKSISVYQSHAFRVARLPQGFMQVANSNQTPYEIFCDERMAMWGTQFHPEKSGVVGEALMRNFLALDAPG